MRIRKRSSQGRLMGQLKITRSFRSHNVLGWSPAVDLLVSSGSNDAVCDPLRPLPMKHTANIIMAIGKINIRMRPLYFRPEVETVLNPESGYGPPSCG